MQEYGYPGGRGGGRQDSRWRSVRGLWWLLFGIAAILVLARFNFESEALTSEEMIGKAAYRDDELTAAIGKSLSPMHNRDKRHDLMARWRRELDWRTPAEQQRIRLAALRLALADARRTAALLQPEEYDRVAHMLTAQAGEFADALPERPEDEATVLELLAPLPEAERALWRPVVERWLRIFYIGEPAA